MWSDNDSEGWFDYKSSQNYSDIDYQIYLFEMRQSFKRDKHWKQKKTPALYPMSTRKLQSHAILLKYSCKRYERKTKIEQKSFGHQKFSLSSRKFECDEEFLMKPIETKRKKQSKSNNNDLIEFSHFRHKFYQENHRRIKSSLPNNSNKKIVNIRSAPINQSVQIQFMKYFNQNSNIVPHLVYHGTYSERIQSILQFGFLVPNQKHPTIKNAPIIRSVNGQVFGEGIYCSRTASYTLGYTDVTNTLLVCAALPNCNKKKQVNYHCGNILVLSNVSQIIPLFLMDFNDSYHELYLGRYWYPSNAKIQTETISKEKTPMKIPKQILRKILKLINNRTRNNERFQLRLFNPLSPDFFGKIENCSR